MSDKNLLQSKEPAESASTGTEQHRTKINWSLAPKDARWWAVDASGEAHWFCPPNVAAFTDFWFSEPIPAPLFDFSGDWKQSLTEKGSIS